MSSLWAATEKRRFPRHTVSWQGGCQRGDTVVWGCVLDINVGGVFLREESSFVAGQRGLSGRSTSQLNPGDKAVLTYTAEAGESPVRVLATVCWRGHSSLHGCPGIGLRFDDLA